MQQLSRPYRILLGAMLVLAVAWFTVLKPSDAESVAGPVAPAASLPGQQGLAGAVAKANGAAATSAAHGSALAAASDDPTGATGASSAAASGGVAPATTAGTAGKRTTVADTHAASAGPAAPILRELRRGRVAVLLFSGRGGADDAAVRRALREIDRHAGRVTVRSLPIASVARYSELIEPGAVVQAPTILVIGSDKRAQRLVGFVDTRSIDQLVADVGGPAFAARPARGYQARLQRVCAAVGASADGAAVGPDLQERLAVVLGSLADARRLGPPARYEAFHKTFVANLRLTAEAYAAVAAAQRAGADANGAYAPFQPRIAASVARVEAAARRARLTPGC